MEKTADLQVTDFKFEQISHIRNSAAYPPSSNGKRNGGDKENKSSRKPFTKPPQQNGGRGGGSGNGELNGDSETETENTSATLSPLSPFYNDAPFTVLKKADVELKVGGKPKTYSVVIKVN